MPDLSGVTGEEELLAAGRDGRRRGPRAQPEYATRRAVVDVAAAAGWSTRWWRSSAAGHDADRGVPGRRPALGAGVEPVPPPPAGDRRERRDGAYVITGGLDEYGLGFAEHLTRRHGARLAILERPDFPADGRWDGLVGPTTGGGPDRGRSRRVRRLRADGATVLVPADRCGAGGHLRGAVAEIDTRLGGPHGVLHTAGLMEELDHRAVRDTTVDFCQERFRRRVHSTIALAEVLRGRALDFCLVLSTLSAQLGGIGRAASAAVSSYANLYTRQCHRDGPSVWVAADWDDGTFDIRPRSRRRQRRPSRRRRSAPRSTG